MAICPCRVKARHGTQPETVAPQCPMKILLSIALVFTLFTSCTNDGPEKTEYVEKIELTEIVNEYYELIRPRDPQAVLVLFGGYPEKAHDIRQEFDLLDEAIIAGIAVVYMNYNQKLSLEEAEKKALALELETIFKDHDLPRHRIYLGGFSSGGNVALLISDFLKQLHSEISPIGVFAIDAPIDLAGLYKGSKQNVERHLPEPAVNESIWILQTLENELGNPQQDIANYEHYSVYTSETAHFDNIQNLQDVKIRFYAEPDTLWWKQNSMADSEQMNAYYIEQLSKLLNKAGFKQVEYITTENKGYRADGERHPHSWSIVDKKKLIEWMMQ